MTVTIYGIKNCDTIKKALQWLNKHQIEYRFHDYRVDGIDTALVAQFCQRLSWQALINKRGTTYRQLTDTQKQTMDQTSAMVLMEKQPAIIKRPLLIRGTQAYLGFKPDVYRDIFQTV